MRAIYGGGSYVVVPSNRARLIGASTLKATARQIDRASARLDGVGALAAVTQQVNRSNARFDGVSSLAAMWHESVWQSNARFVGASALAASVRQVDRVSARFPGTSLLQASGTIPADDGETIVCDLNATTATFAAQVAAATAGQTICLASGDYGTWTGTNKAITIAPQSGANVTMGLALGNGAQDFTIDGGHTEISISTNGMVRSAVPFTSTGISLDACAFTGNPGPSNITIKRCWVVPQSFGGGFFEFNGPRNTNIVFDRLFFTDIADGEACIRAQDHFDLDLTIKNCFFYDLTCDGVKLDTQAVTVQDCEFMLIHPHGTAEHSDCIQFQGSASNHIIVRNLFLDFEQALAGFDGMGSCTITDNVCNNRTIPAVHWITCGADNPASIVDHNTVVGSAVGGGTDPIIICGSKPSNSLSITSITNNIGQPDTSGIAGGAAGQPTDNDHNMFSGAGSPNINGTPTFVGGSSAATWQGYKLTGGSSGLNAASDGLNVGARIA